MSIFMLTRIQKWQSKLSSFSRLIIFTVVGFSTIYSCAASPTGPKTQICTTTGCNEAAQNILDNMDQTIDPCNNFYHFACGNFVKQTIIPEDKSSVSIFGRKADVLQNKLKQSIEGELEESDPKTFKLLQSYYNLCLDTENTNMEEVKELLKTIGNWPVVVGNSWNEKNFDWKQMIYQLRNIGYTSSVNSIMKFVILIDQKNTTRNIISLDQATTGLSYEYISKGVHDNVVQAYYRYMVQVAKILGAESKEAEKELIESLNFEIELAKISLPKVERRNMSRLYNLKTVRQLQSEYSNIPWYEYLNQLLSPQSHINLEDEVNVMVPTFLESLTQLLAKTPKRVLANYMVWRVVMESSEYMNEQVKKVKAEFYATISGTNVQEPQWIKCIDYVSDKLPVATGALYVRKNFDPKTKSDAENLVNKLRKSFENMLKRVDWMDSETKKAALVKLNSIKTHVAYPDEFFDNKKLDKHYENLEVDANSFFKSHLKLNLFDLKFELEQFLKPVDKTHWLTRHWGTVAMVNAMYTNPKNNVQIPAGILQGEFFTSTRPSYMNYGAIGWVIGHEFTHGFDDKGSQYDKDGNLANWWDTETKKEYLKRAQCIIDQYSNYTVEEVGLKLNGKLAQGENIGDNGGIREAYFAYEEFERQNGKEPHLPGLMYSPRQLFWISAANMWCDKRRPEQMKNQVFTDVHSPAEFRVVGSFSNVPEFSRDFNCPLGSPMNPVKKCTVW